jgi:hypothetical protein
MDGNLHQATEDARDVLAALRDALAYGADESIDDADLKFDTLEGETDVFEMIDKALLEVALAKSHAASIADVMANLQTRKRRLAARVETLRTALAVTLEAIEETKVQRPTATISLPKAKTGLEIDPDREHEIPEEYLEIIKPDPIVKIRTDEIIAALQADDAKEIIGCKLVELPRSVSIRTK